MGFQAFLTENLLCAVELLTLLGIPLVGDQGCQKLTLAGHQPIKVFFSCMRRSFTLSFLIGQNAGGKTLILQASALLFPRPFDELSSSEAAKINLSVHGSFADSISTAHFCPCATEVHGRPFPEGALNVLLSEAVSRAPTHA